MSSESKVFNLCLCVVILQGINLSGGQRQRICVARALYQNTNIVFLVGTNFSNTDNLPPPSTSDLPHVRDVMNDRSF